MDTRIHSETELAEAVGDDASLKKFNLIMSNVGTEVAGKLPEIKKILESTYTELLKSTSNGGQKSVSKPDSHSSELLGAEEKEISPDHDPSASSQEKSGAVEKSTVCSSPEDEID
jgi:hypothetical protein